MKKIILGIAGACALAGLATTASAQMYGDVANVLSATAIFDRANIPRECRVEPTNSQQRMYPKGYRTAANEACDNTGTPTGRIVGYEVQYEYNGHQFTTRMPYDPGPQMPVNVEVRPPLPRDSNISPRTPNYRGPY